MEIEAAAKLNLWLRVLGKREDGFHEIDSLMVALPGLHDHLRIERAAEDSFSCNMAGVPSDESNLVIRARNVFRRKTGREDCLAITLEKRVPHGAGLGGGSSDAGATLEALDRYFATGLSDDLLRDLAAEIGSDVPFFLKPTVARVRGRGERIEAVPQFPALPVLLLKPSFGVSTPEAYRNWQRARALPGVCYEPQPYEWGELVNDLEMPVFQKFPFLAEVKMWLLKQKGVRGALMSGSGSTMFALLAHPELADEMAERARAELDPRLWTWSGWTAGDHHQDSI